MIYISGPCVSITHELLHGSGPWLVNLWHRCLSLQPVGHDRGPRETWSLWGPRSCPTGWRLKQRCHRLTSQGPLSDLVESQFPQSDGKVLHRSAQNGTGARKEICRCSCPAMPETNITSSGNMREHGGWFHLFSRLWPNPALRRSKTRVN